MEMGDIAGLSVLFAAFVLFWFLFVAYTKGWCCDGGIIRPHIPERQLVRENVEKKIKYQIKKMVEAERNAKRLAQIATSGTDEDPNEYLENLRNLLFPPTIAETSHIDPFSWINTSSETHDIDNNIISFNQNPDLVDFHPSFPVSSTSPMEMSSFAIGIDMDPPDPYDPEFDQPPSYEECMKRINKYDHV